MGETVSFTSNGDAGRGLPRRPRVGLGPRRDRHPGVVGARRRRSRACATGSRPRGSSRSRPTSTAASIAEHTEMDKAAQLMMTLPIDRAARDMGGAVDYLLGARRRSTGDAVGVVGFCMGGMLALCSPRSSGDKIAAVGAVLRRHRSATAQPDWSNLHAAVQGHFAENDDFFPPDADRGARSTSCSGMGKDVESSRYPGTGHAFANEDNAFGTYDAEPRPSLALDARIDVPPRAARRSASCLSASRPERAAASRAASRPALPPAAAARSMLIASRGSRSGQVSHGPGGIVRRATHARAGTPGARAPRLAPPTGPWPGTIVSRELGDRVEHVGPQSPGRPGTRAA